MLDANCRRERAGTPEGSSDTKQGGAGGIRIEQNGDAETMWRAWGDHCWAPCWGPETTAAVWLRCMKSNVFDWRNINPPPAHTHAHAKHCVFTSQIPSYCLILIANSLLILCLTHGELCWHQLLIAPGKIMQLCFHSAHRLSRRWWRFICASVFPSNIFSGLVVEYSWLFLKM